MDQVESTRNSKPSCGVISEISSRVLAGKKLNKTENNKPIHIPEREQTLRKNIQKDCDLAIVGADVVSLFPSLKNIETARLARHAIL